MIESIIHWLVQTVGQLGYIGIIGLMAIESSFIPFPSEVVIPPAGYLAFQGQMNLFLVIFSGILGSIIGALVNYWIGLRFGPPIILKLGKYVGFNKDKYKKTETFFRDHGEVSTFIGRLIPGIRQLISFPAGVAKMKISHFIFYTSLGAGIWSIVLALLGYYVGQEEELLRKYYKEITIALLIFCAVILVAYIWMHKRKKKNSANV